MTYSVYTDCIWNTRLYGPPPIRTRPYGPCFRIIRPRTADTDQTIRPIFRDHTAHITPTAQPYLLISNNLLTYRTCLSLTHSCIVSFILDTNISIQNERTFKLFFLIKQVIALKFAPLGRPNFKAIACFIKSSGSE